MILLDLLVSSGTFSQDTASEVPHRPSELRLCHRRRACVGPLTTHPAPKHSTCLPCKNTSAAISRPDLAPGHCVNHRCTPTNCTPKEARTSTAMAFSKSSVIYCGADLTSSSTDQLSCSGARRFPGCVADNVRARGEQPDVVHTHLWPYPPSLAQGSTNKEYRPND